MLNRPTARADAVPLPKFKLSQLLGLMHVTVMKFFPLFILTCLSTIVTPSGEVSIVLPQTFLNEM
jgi:hypothetical protein